MGVVMPLKGRSGRSMLGAALVCSGALLAAEPDDARSNPRLAAYQAQMQSDQQQHPTLKIGAAAPDFSLPGTDDRMHRLADYKRSPILAIVFISNHCPASQLYEGRIKGLLRDYAAKGLALVAIAPNGPQAASPSELNYTDVDDSLESMKIRAAYRSFKFDYLYDGATQAVSHLYGPKVTPHLFIFDAQRKLRYEGRIDDHLQEAKATRHEARDALDALVAGKPVPVEHTPVFGCSTKWMSHALAAREEMQQWLALPVDVETATLVELTRLRSNPQRKLLLVNFWATWCAPCKSEYPKLLETYLWYRSREFDFVSVAVDAPEQRAAVAKFLKVVHSGVRNLQVDTDDVYGVMAAFDRSWESGVPFSMLIDPDGHVIFQHAGEVDVLELRRTLLAHLPDAGPFAGNTDYWRH
jgi:peroxiredoxin